MQDNSPTVLYEDESLLFLSKPAGLPSAPIRGRTAPTAVTFALNHCPALEGIGAQPHEAGLLHRLDTATSGILVFAKSHDVFRRLRELWLSDSVQKYYIAIVKQRTPDAALPAPPFMIEFPIAHSPKTSKKVIAVRSPHGPLARLKSRIARTEVLSVVAGALCTYKVELRIHTGVLHQIRCHLSEVGFPVMGDRLYQGIENSRLLLHAHKMIMILPWMGIQLEVRNPPPTDFNIC